MMVDTHKRHHAGLLIGGICIGVFIFIALMTAFMPPGPATLTKKRWLPVVVDYARIAPHVGDDLQNIVPEPGTPAEKNTGTGVRSLKMSVIGAKGYRHAALSPWRPATRAELLAFVRQHPQESAQFTRLCARGTAYHDKQYPQQLLYPAVNYQKKSLGYVSISCTAQLIVVPF